MLATRYTVGMGKKKMTTYIDEDLLRSAKVLAAQSDGKIYEAINEALREYLEERDALEASLENALSNRQTHRQPGIPRGKAMKLREGETLSGAVIAECEERDY